MKKLFYILVGLISLSSQMIVWAQRPPIIPEIPGDNEDLLLPHQTSGNIAEEQYFGGVLLPTITRTVIALAGGLAFLFMIVGGIQILTAYGNEEKIQNGKKTLTYALVGLVIALLSYAIVSIISAIRL